MVYFKIKREKFLSLATGVLLHLHYVFKKDESEFALKFKVKVEVMKWTDGVYALRDTLLFHTLPIFTVLWTEALHPGIH